MSKILSFPVDKTLLAFSPAFGAVVKMIRNLFFKNFNEIYFLIIRSQHSLIFATTASKDLVTFKDLDWEK